MKPRRNPQGGALAAESSYLAPRRPQEHGQDCHRTCVSAAPVSTLLLLRCPDNSSGLNPTAPTSLEYRPPTSYNGRHHRATTTTMEPQRTHPGEDTQGLGFLFQLRCTPLTHPLLAPWIHSAIFKRRDSCQHHHQHHENETHPLVNLHPPSDTPYSHYQCLDTSRIIHQAYLPMPLPPPLPFGILMNISTQPHTLPNYPFHAPYKKVL